jgi:hypothetical protein
MQRWRALLVDDAGPACCRLLWPTDRNVELSGGCSGLLTGRSNCRGLLWPTDRKVDLSELPSGLPTGMSICRSCRLAYRPEGRTVGVRRLLLVNCALAVGSLLVVTRRAKGKPAKIPVPGLRNR